MRLQLLGAAFAFAGAVVGPIVVAVASYKFNFIRSSSKFELCTG